MAATARIRRKRKRKSFLRSLATLALVIGTLYLAKPVIVPLALAVLLTFILTPLVSAVQRRGLRRVPAVLVVVSLTLIIFGVVGWGVGTQVARLARDLPAHASEIRAKVARLRGTGTGPFSRMLDSIRDTGNSPADPVSTKSDTGEPAPGSTSSAVPDKQVIIAQPAESSGLERLAAVAVVVLEPVASAGLILILVIFMLIRREDLRNRIIGLLGHNRLTGTTRVIVQSASRISRLLLMQLCVNASFGLLFGVGLLAIGVPYWFLWGFLTFVLRFVPYIGTWMAAALPVILSFVISPGWAQPAMTLGLFLVLDLATANAIEPLLFGHSTGVSPVALLVAAVFWTWIWGPIGLVLSTPLTVCLVVLGQHVPRLRFLSLLLGDQPALAPHVVYYQRLLAGDSEEAAAVVRGYARSEGVEHVPDDILVPALLLARRDRRDAGLTAEDETFIFEATQAVLDDLERPAPAAGSAAKAIAAETAEGADGAPDCGPGALILGCPAHHRAEELTLRMLGAVMKPSGCRTEFVSTRALPVEIEARIERDRPELLFVSVLPPGGVVQARYLCRRLRKRFADLKIVIGYWGRVRNFDKLLVSLRSSGASYVTTSILQSRGQIVALLPAAGPPAVPAVAAAGTPTVASAGAATS